MRRAERTANRMRWDGYTLPPSIRQAAADIGTGCYAFATAKRCLYVGRSERLAPRILRSAIERGIAAYDDAELWIWATDTTLDAWHLEADLLAYFQPPLNKLVPLGPAVEPDFPDYRAALTLRPPRHG